MARGEIDLQWRIGRWLVTLQLSVWTPVHAAFGVNVRLMQAMLGLPFCLLVAQRIKGTPCGILKPHTWRRGKYIVVLAPAVTRGLPIVDGLYVKALVDWKTRRFRLWLCRVTMRGVRSHAIN